MFKLSKCAYHRQHKACHQRVFAGESRVFFYELVMHAAMGVLA